MKTMNLTAVLPVLAIPVLLAFIPYFQADSKKCVAIEKGIRFETKGWDSALLEAKKHNRLVFLDAYTSWCGPCKLLKKNTFTDKAVGDFFNTNFINVTEDMEKGIGLRLAEQYKVSAYPTLIITDFKGTIISYTIGYLTPEQLLDFGRHGLAVRAKP